MENVKTLMRFFFNTLNKISSRLFNIKLLLKENKNYGQDATGVIKSLGDVLSSNNTFQTFKDENGQTFKVINGLRDFLKPHWRTMFEPPIYNLPSEKDINHIFNNALKLPKIALKTLGLFGIDVKKSKAIEIGCYDGIRSIALRYLGVREVIASDTFEYFNNSFLNYFGIKELEENLRKYLYNFRMLFINNFLSPTPFKKSDPKYNITNINNFSFVFDDIINSKLPSEEFDLVFSWECLEHFIDPKKSILNIGRILKSGGYAYHRYNPFFALNGGHSLCTLDIPWGHAMLSEHGILKYFREFRLNELELSNSLYLTGLNRMTLNDLKKFAKKAKLETMLVLPSPNLEHLEILDLKTINRVKELYPSVDILELISPEITIIHKKI